MFPVACGLGGVWCACMCFCLHLFVGGVGWCGVVCVRVCVRVCVCVFCVWGFISCAKDIVSTTGIKRCISVGARSSSQYINTDAHTRTYT
jgi:hypothetical protein